MSTATLVPKPMAIEPERKELNPISIALVNGIRKAVADRGEDFVYPNSWREDSLSGTACKYVVDGQAACIVGYAIKEATGRNWTYNNNSAASVLRGDFPLVGYGRVHEAVVRAMAAAQNIQDKGSPWGQALEAFESKLAREGITV